MTSRLEESVHRRLAELEAENCGLRRELQRCGRAANNSEVFQQLIDNIHQVLWITDWHHPHQVLYVSKSYETVWGRTCQSLYDDARSWADNIHPEDQARVLQAWERDVEPGCYEQEYRIIRADGSVSWIHDRAFPLRDASGRAYRVAGISEDVTRRHDAEAVLQQAHDELERRVQARTATLRAAHHRLELQEAALRKIVEATAQVGAALFQAVVEQLATALQVRFAFVSELIDADRAKLRLLSCWQDGGHGPCFTYDARGTPCEAVIRGELSFHRCGVRERFPQDRWLQEHGLESYLAIPLRDSSGTVLGHLGLAHSAPLADEVLAEAVLKILAARVAAELERERTAREQALLRERLHQAEKMQALGELASGVAHDFNNSLTIIFAVLDQACATLATRGESALLPEARGPGQQQCPAGDEDAVRALDVIRQAAREAQEVTRSLILVSHPDTEKKEPVNLRAVFRELLHVVRVLLPASIECRLKDHTSFSAWVNGSSAQIRRIMINLVANARDAMPDGGRLELRLRPATSRDRRRCGAAQSTAWVALVIADNGQGIPAADLARVCEPFFTTKPRTKGTGLGLAIVHSAVRDHGGCIDIASRPVRGTVVTVLLPLSGPPAVAGARALAVTVPAGHGELLLVAEDNPQLCKLISMSLQERGYEVAAAADGLTALRRFGELGTAVRAVIMDLDLPGLGGLQCLQRIRAEDQTIPAILITGSAPPDTPADPAGLTVLLSKPFRMVELAEVVHRLVGGVARDS